MRVHPHVKGPLATAGRCYCLISSKSSACIAGEPSVAEELE